jgi:hypothetical protein
MRGETLSKNDLLALAAAIAGGVLGHLGFLWIARQGFYGLVLPGAAVGVAASLLKPKATAVFVACGVLALAAGLFSEWRFAPFIQDSRLRYFFAHLYQLRPITILMLAAGTVLGFWLPLSSRKG